MSQPDDRRSDLAVMDANEFKNKRRLKEILESREQVFATREKAEEAFIAGDIERDGRNLLILHAVREYLEEVWNLLLDHAKEFDDIENSEYLAGRTLGKIRFHSDEREDIEINGLYEYMYCDRQYRETWTEEVPWRHGEDVTVTRSATHTIPAEVSRRAFLTINEFLNEEDDLDIQFEDIEDETPTWGFERVDENGTDPTDREVI